MPTDRTTKVLLALICLTLWVIILQPLFQATPAMAQSRPQYDLQRYDLGSNSANGGVQELVNHLRDRPKQGWRVIQMTTLSPTGVTGAFMYVLWQK